MVSLKDIKGQDNAVRYLRNILVSEKKQNSFLFSGPGGVGKALTAGAFITAFLCQDPPAPGEACGICPACRKAGNMDHPDLIWIRPEKNRSIKIEDIRRVKDIVNLKPYESPVVACVIEDAHMMTTEASNALLKVLEEPPSHAVIILVTDKKELLLETVVSRCSEVRFTSLGTRQTADIIMSATGMDTAAAELLAYFSQGSPGMAMEMSEGDLSSKREAFIRKVLEVMESPSPQYMNWPEDDKNALIDDLEMMVMMLRDVSMEREGFEGVPSYGGVLPAEAFDKYTADDLLAVMGRIIRLKRELMGNVNPKLAAQALPGIIRGKG